MKKLVLILWKKKVMKESMVQMKKVTIDLTFIAMKKAIYLLILP